MAADNSAEKPTDYEVHPATAADWPALATILGRYDDHGCWCQYWRLSSGDYRRRPPGDGQRLMQAQLAGEPAPGIVAYLGTEPVGWLGLWPRTMFERLERSRTIPKLDELPVWSIVCFMVRPGYRRRGVATALLRGAIDYARSAGAPALEAYPIDAAGSRVDTAFAYVGFTSTFAKVGFEKVADTDAHSASRPRVIMRLALS